MGRHRAARLDDQRRCSRGLIDLDTTRFTAALDALIENAVALTTDGEAITMRFEAVDGELVVGVADAR